MTTVKTLKLILHTHLLSDGSFVNGHFLYLETLAGSKQAPGEGPSGEGAAGEATSAPPSESALPAPSEAPSDAGAKSEKGVAKSKGGSKPGGFVCTIQKSFKQSSVLLTIEGKREGGFKYTLLINGAR